MEQNYTKISSKNSNGSDFDNIFNISEEKLQKQVYELRGLSEEKTEKEIHERFASLRKKFSDFEMEFSEIEPINNEKEDSINESWVNRIKSNLSKSKFCNIL